ncbi:MAG: hypothetical protein K2K56_08805 [Lachnospiraceae bacterium]|nr:hypothetical protein [Lachnospiraceae bacterium]
MLQDYELKKFYEESEFSEFVDDFEMNTIRTNFFLSEMEIYPLDNVPILVDEIMKKLQIAVDREAVIEAMSSSSLAVKAPTAGSLRTYPVSGSAIPSLNARAGFIQASCLRYGNNSSRSEMSPTDRANVLNAGIKCYKTRGLSVIRDQKIRAVLSGDAQDYAVIPANEVFKTSRNVLSKLNGKSVSFLYGNVSHDFTTFCFLVDKPEILDAIKVCFNKASIPWDDTYHMAVKIVTSDTGLCGCNVYPMLIKKSGAEFPLGTSLKTTHKHGHTISDVSASVDKVFASFREATVNIDKLADYQVKYSSGLVMYIGKNVKLPKGMVMKAFEEFTALYGENVYGVDIYFLLLDILDRCYREGKMTSYIQLVTAEGIARLMFFDNIQNIDYPFQWE